MYTDKFTSINWKIPRIGDTFYSIFFNGLVSPFPCISSSAIYYLSTYFHSAGLLNHWFRWIHVIMQIINNPCACSILWNILSSINESAIIFPAWIIFGSFLYIPLQLNYTELYLLFNIRGV